MASEAQQWASQAALNALLKYKPQKEGLAELQKAAEDRFRESVDAGQSEGIMGQQAARQAVPATQQIFSSARQSGERGRDLVAPILAALSANSPFKAAAANEQAAGTERLGQSESHALSDLQQRSVAAAELPAYTRSAATATLLKELQKVASKGALLQGSEGADVQSEIGKQRQEANRLAQQERANERTTSTSENNSRRSTATSEANNQRSTGTSRKNSEETNATRRSSSGANKPLTAAEQNKGAGVIQNIRHYAGELGAGQAPRAELVKLLSEGQPQSSHPRPVTINGKTVTEHIPVPKIPAYTADVLMSAGIDLAEKGGLSKDTWSRLERAGYNVSNLGFKRYQEPSYGQSKGLHSRAHTG